MGISKGEFHVEQPSGAAAAVLFLVEGLQMAGEVMPLSEELLLDVYGQVKTILGIKERRK